MNFTALTQVANKLLIAQLLEPFRLTVCHHALPPADVKVLFKVVT